MPLVRVTELDELEVLVPDGLLCQYQVIPLGGFPRVSTVLPQLLVTFGLDGVATEPITVTFTLPVYLVCPHDMALLRYHLLAVSPPGGFYVVEVAPLMLVQPLLPFGEYCHW